MEKVKISVYVDEDIHKRIKYKAFDDNLTVQAIVEEALTAYIKPEHAAEASGQKNFKKEITQSIKRLIEDDESVLADLAVALRAIERIRQKDKKEVVAA